MDSHFVYIIYSPSHKRFYHGMTTNMKERLGQHNSGKVKSTKAFLPWVICKIELYKTVEEARKRELYFKTGSGRRYLKVIKENYTKEMESSPPA
jgi:putative endonuclease